MRLLHRVTQHHGGFGDLVRIPAIAILILERDQVTQLIQPGVVPSIVHQQQRQQPGHFAFLRHQGAEQARQPYCLLHQTISDKEGTAGGGISFVEERIKMTPSTAVVR